MNKIFILILFPFFLQAQTPDTVDVDIILDLSGVTTDGFWKQFHTNEIYYNYPVSILKDTNSLTDADLYINDVNEDFATKLILQNIHSGNDRNSSIEIIPNSSNILQLKSFGNNSASSVFGVALSNWNYILGQGQGLVINTTGTPSKLKLGAGDKERLTIESDGDLLFPHLKTGTPDSLLMVNANNEAIRMKLSPDNFTIGSDVIYTKNYVEIEYTSDGTYTKNNAAKRICVHCIGAAGGGGSGAVNTPVNGNYAYGGTGGGSGGYSYKCFEASNFPSGSVGVVVGTGGTGGAGVTGNGSQTLNGNNGGFGGYSGIDGLVLATGGRGGHKGVTTSTFPDLSVGNWYTNGYGSGGIGLFNGANADQGHANLPYVYSFENFDVTYSSAAGGSATGVFWNSGIANTASNAQDSKLGYLTNQNATAYSGIGGIETTITAPTQPTLIHKSRVCGGGGGGIPAVASGSTNTARNGASVTLSKCTGGGGGGAGVISGSTITSGAGGNGGNGYVLIIEYF